MTPLNDEDSEMKRTPLTPGERNWLMRSCVIIGSVVVLIFSGVIGYRLLTASFAAVDFSEIISLVLALFSIWLSAQFYFKATDTSNKFYDRTYRMTKDLFEILGRIEERFGVMLKHIHEDTAATRIEFMQSKNESRVKIESTDSPAVPPESKSTKLAKERE